MRTTLDFTPLFRSTVGFDRLASLLNLEGRETTNSYPPYNIEKHGNDQYHIVMAIAGFGEDDIDITFQENLLIVKGKIQESVEKDQKIDYLHRGIANRSFEHKFQLADHIRVNNARLENGLLMISLVREVPEALKPRKIEVSGPDKKVIDAAPAKKSIGRA